MNNKVTLAYLQAPTSVPGIFMQQTTLDATNNRQSKTPGITMRLTEWGLLVSKDNLSAIIPMTNIKVAILASESENQDDKTPKKSK
jgi:hypothetical protein